MNQTKFVPTYEKQEITVTNKCIVYLIYCWQERRLVKPRGIAGGRSCIGGNQFASFVSC